MNNVVKTALSMVFENCQAICCWYSVRPSGGVSALIGQERCDLRFRDLSAKIHGLMVKANLLEKGVEGMEGMEVGAHQLLLG